MHVCFVGVFGEIDLAVLPLADLVLDLVLVDDLDGLAEEAPPVRSRSFGWRRAAAAVAEVAVRPLAT